MQTANLNNATLFNEAINKYFGVKPTSPIWALVVLYLRKTWESTNFKFPANESIEQILDLSEYSEPVMDNNFFDWSYRNLISHLADESIVEQEEFVEIIRGLLGHSRYHEYRTNSIFFPKDSGTQVRDGKALLDLAESLSKLDDSWFQENFEDAFDALTHRCLQVVPFRMGETPKEVVELLGKLIGDNAPDIYNPFSGAASLVTAVRGKGQMYVGVENDEIAAIIGSLRIIAFGLRGYIYIDNPLDAVPVSTPNPLVSIPPFGLEINDSKLAEEYGGKNDYASLLMRKCVKEGVRGIIVCPTGMNFAGGYRKELRKFLIENGSLDMIINLPDNLFYTTGVSTSIYVIDPHHNHPGSVRLINARDSYTKEKRINRLDVKGIVGLIQDGGAMSTVASIEEIEKNDYSLAPENYIAPDVKIPDGAKLMPLAKLGDFTSNIARNKVAEGLYASISDLSNPNKLKIFTPEDFKLTNMPAAVLELNNDCILITPHRGFRCVLVSPMEETLYSNTNYYSFVPNTSVVLPQYLVLQLQEKYAINQMAVTTMTSVSQETLKGVQILVPSLEEQKNVIAKYQEELIGSLGMELNSLKSQRESEFEQNTHLRKHALKQILQEVVPAARRISKFICANEGEFSKRSIVAERSQATLEQYVQKLQANVTRIQNLVSQLTDDEVFDPAENLDLMEFLRDYREQKFTNDNYEIEIRCYSQLYIDPEEELDQECVESPDLIVPISSKGLKTVLDNIFSNAVKYGFTESRLDYRINVTAQNIMVNNVPMVEIRIRNNGNPLPTGMTPDKIFTWGASSRIKTDSPDIVPGTGLGTWQAKNIIEHYGGTVQFFQLDDDVEGYTIEYVITLPMVEL